MLNLTTMNKISITTITVLFFFANAASASECREKDKDKLEYFAEEASEQIVESYGGGQDVIVEINDCEWNTYKDTYKMAVEIYWNGSLFRSTEYNVDGEVRFSSIGKNVKFSQTYASESVKKLDFWTKVAGGAIILGDIAIKEHQRAVNQ